MNTIYVLMRNTIDRDVYDMLGWFDDRDRAEAAALERCWASYRENVGKPSYQPKWSPDETEWREFFIEELQRL